MSGLFRLSIYVVALALVAFPGVVLGQIDKPIEPSNISIDLTETATGLTAPIWGTAAPGVDGRLFVADQSGALWAVNIAIPGPVGGSPFLDLRERNFGLDICHERGLLGVAFHPDYGTVEADGFGRFYTYTSEVAIEPADFTTIPDGAMADHQSIITEWRVSDPTNPDVSIDANSGNVLLRIDQPQCEKNAGALSFGPDENDNT